METDINAIGMIFAPIFALIVSLIWGTNPDRRQIIFAIFISFVIPLAIFYGLLPLVYEDMQAAPVYQLFVPFLCMLPILLLVKKKLIEYAANSVLLILAVGLSIHWTYIIDGQKYSYLNPLRSQSAYAEKIRIVQETLFKIAQEDSNSYPEGYLSKSSLMAKAEMFPIITEYIAGRNIVGYKLPVTFNLWHSSFTGIYGISIHNPDIWYPGGTLSGKTINKISLKEANLLVVNNSKSLYQSQ